MFITRDNQNNIYILQRYTTSSVQVYLIWIRARVSPCGNCRGKMALGQVGLSPRSSIFPINVIPPWLFTLIYHLDE
jgi:hypothetical protein